MCAREAGFSAPAQQEPLPPLALLGEDWLFQRCDSAATRGVCFWVAWDVFSLARCSGKGNNLVGCDFGGCRMFFCGRSETLCSLMWSVNMSQWDNYSVYLRGIFVFFSFWSVLACYKFRLGSVTYISKCVHVDMHKRVISVCVLALRDLSIQTVSI